MTLQAGRAQHGPTYNGPIYLYRLSILSGRAQETFSMACALLGPASDDNYHIVINFVCDNHDRQYIKYFIFHITHHYNLVNRYINL